MPRGPQFENVFHVNLRRIAEATGHSQMTVSRALRDRPDVAVETRKRILGVAEKLGYRPNLLVQGVKTGRSGNIALLICPSGDFGAGMVRGAHDELVRRQYLPLLHWKWVDAAKGVAGAELEMIHRVLDRRVEGVILFPQDDSVPDLYFREVWQRGVPLVTVDRHLPRTHADFVGTDDQAGARMAAEHLLALGHRCVAHLAGKRKYGTYADRRSGFEGAIAKAKGCCVTVEIEDPEAASRAAERILRATQRPTAVFLAADHYALGVYHAAARMGLRIPDDLSVVGFADLSLASCLTPPLTTVRQDPYGIGREAARIVIDRCSGRLTSKEPVQLRLTPELIVRGSTVKASDRPNDTSQSARRTRGGT
ncbi:MAG: LacI family DNA-binding transcriptional regulator [Planctomycetota bacterium]|nr:LacI family DNA-binding transcriptional regulator [Planctomycetota bacterium]